MANSTVINRVVLRNYKSIAFCDVTLGPLMFLIGKNGAGKSNFLEAISFVADALANSPRDAIRKRGGNLVARLQHDQPSDRFGVRLDFRGDDGIAGHFGFEIRFNRLANSLDIEREECKIVSPLGTSSYTRTGNSLDQPSLLPVAVMPDRLYLSNLTGYPGFRLAFELLTNVIVYHFDTDVIGNVQPTLPGVGLLADGGNLPNVLAYIQNRDPEAFRRIVADIRTVNPNILDLYAADFPGGFKSYLFNIKTNAGDVTITLPAPAMSAGTLRALAILTALELPDPARTGATNFEVIGIEEPEMAIHPGATGIILKALFRASARVQILVTSQSPDLLDDKGIESDSILAFSVENGTTEIGPIDDASREVLARRLYSPGELMRSSSIEPDFRHTREVDRNPPNLFDQPLAS